MGSLLDKPVTEKDTEEGESRGVKYSISNMQGWRPEQEDRHIACTSVDERLDEFYVFSVFDGHGGDYTARYAEQHMIRILKKQEHFQFYANLPAQSLRDHPIGLELLQSAFLSTYLELDEEMASDDGRLLESGKLDKSGATACTVVMTPSHIMCINAGDSRAMYRTGGQTAQLSFDHKPHSDDERARIEAAGGYVSMKRVDGDLAVSRALGDFQYKSNDYLPPDLQKVISVPDFVVVDRDHLRDEFVVICCDGIWDVLTCWQCSDLVQTILDEGETDFKLVVEELLDVALEKASKDNMTAILVFFPNNVRIGKGGEGVSARRIQRQLRQVEESQRRQEREMAKQKLKTEADEVRRRLAQRHYKDEIDSDSD